MNTAIIGGGAAGLFLAINLKELIIKSGRNAKTMQVTVFEKNDKILSKLEISGGGRCNCTNTFEFANKNGSFFDDLAQVYPRGHRSVKKMFHIFSPKDAFKWFETHGVKLKIEDNGRVFPQSDDSHTIINVFKHYAALYDIDIRLNDSINSLSRVEHFDFICVACGGLLHNNLLSLLKVEDSIIVKPIPSLFAFNVEDSGLRALSGTTLNGVTLMFPKTKFKVSDSVIITHKGLSGPAVLRLSSYAAVFLNEANYNTPLLVNWIGRNNEDATATVNHCKILHANKMIMNINPFALPQRFWEYILVRVVPNRLNIRYKDLTEKEISRIVDAVCNDKYLIKSRSNNKEEFVTCGGVDLSCIDINTMRLKADKRLFFVGEALNIDGITGGYNFQVAWTTAFIAAQEICNIYLSNPVQ